MKLNAKRFDELPIGWKSFVCGQRFYDFFRQWSEM